MMKRISSLEFKKGGGGMPPFQVSLKEEDVKTLAAWLAEMK
ncbi:c-type cytochrome [Paenibacillus hexagrammi]|uniref:Cytochrome c n=1 Tax=Paenibacillus hexagrammi TaxID=2908839 RepID=A0ABY3SJF1_9BACL|nr:cytochrome c [Paenibacillus sp. YPD9-1]UJF34169.1 cytochrome c [Paenibacillus sp. YPD9-1]